MKDYYTNKRKSYLRSFQENRLQCCGIRTDKEKAVILAFFVILLVIAVLK